jgi:hypothetical protein
MGKRNQTFLKKSRILMAGRAYCSCHQRRSGKRNQTDAGSI